MKKIKLASIALFAVALISFSSCKDDANENDEDSSCVFNGNVIGSGVQEFEITGNQVIKKGTYLLKGWCYIKAGATLTIEPGTIIKGDKQTKAALIVEPGGKLIAKGTALQPIVFTSEEAPGSRRPGDWGGLIICGNAKNNNKKMKIEGGPVTMHGGDDDDDNSGIIQYVRVEFAGYPFQTDQEINGITLGSVGRGTTFDHVQVSYSNDDSFEWFGGTVNAKYLIAYHGWDDEFDTDNGFSGYLQFLLSVRHPKLADTSWSNGFESDNNSDGSTAEPYTSCTFSNVTFVGPMGQDPAFINNSSYINGGSLNPNNGSKLGQFQAAMQIRRNSKLNCFNSVAMGYPVGLLLDAEKGAPGSPTFAKEGQLGLKNIYFAGMQLIGSDINKSLKDRLSINGKDTVPGMECSYSHTFFLAQSGNTHLPSVSDLKLKQPNSLSAGASYVPMAGSPLLNKAGLFTDTRVSNGFFSKVDYIGAFSGESDTWATGWTNFDPQNTIY